MWSKVCKIVVMTTSFGWEAGAKLEGAVGGCWYATSISVLYAQKLSSTKQCPREASNHRLPLATSSPRNTIVFICSILLGVGG